MKSVFHSTYLRQQKSLGEEHDLTDLLKVRNNDHDRAEKGLHGLWKFGTTGVTRIHCNEDPDSLVHYDLLTLKLKNKPQRINSYFQFLNSIFSKSIFPHINANNLNVTHTDNNNKYLRLILEGILAD